MGILKKYRHADGHRRHCPAMQQLVCGVRLYQAAFCGKGPDLSDVCDRHMRQIAGNTLTASGTALTPTVICAPDGISKIRIDSGIIGNQIEPWPPASDRRKVVLLQHIPTGS